MKILLTNPPCKQKIDARYEKYFVRAGSRWPHSNVKRIGELPHYIPFPFFLAYTAALLLKDNFSIEVIDGVALDMNRETFLKKVMDIAPEVILFETTTPTIEYDLDLIKEIKRHIHSRIILCGSHATTFAKDLLEKSGEVDFIILGEYESTALNLMHSLREGKPVEETVGIACRQGGKVVVGKRAPLIEMLDELPFPARDLFPQNSSPDMKIYWDSFCQNRPALQMHASRGCPYRCYFCLWNQVMYGNGKYRLFSPKRVVDEMEEVIKNYDAREIYFDDDDFAINRNHVLGICREIKERRLKIKWSCMGDAINLDEEEIRRMADSGCIGMKFGVESGSLKVLEKVGKPVDLRRVKEISRWCTKYGIKTHATFSIGLLGETIKSIKESLNFTRHLDVDTIQVSICTPFPGTRFYEEALYQKVLRYTSWEEFDGKTRELLEYPDLSSKKMEEFRREFFRAWLLSRLFQVSWILRQVKYLFRWIKGTGFVFIMKRLYAELRDELSKRET